MTLLFIARAGVCVVVARLIIYVLCSWSFCLIFGFAVVGETSAMGDAISFDLHFISFALASESEK